MKRKGVNLIEILVVAGISSIILIPLFFFFVSRQKQVALTEREFYALDAIYQAKEQIIGMGKENLYSQKFDFKPEVEGSRIGNSPFALQFTPQALKFRREIEIEKNDKGDLWLTLIISEPQRKTRPLKDRIYLGRSR